MEREWTEERRENRESDIEMDRGKRRDARRQTKED